MNDQEDPNTEDPNAEEPKKGPTDPNFDDFAESVRNAFRTGGKDAREAVDNYLPKAKEEFGKGIHDVAYAVSYAAAFGTALLREIAPEPLTDGVREGKEAGQRAADEVIRNRKEREERGETYTPEDDPGPVAV